MRSDAFETHIRKHGDTKGMPTAESSVQINACPICRHLIDCDQNEADTLHLIRSFKQDHFNATGQRLKQTDTQPYAPVPAGADERWLALNSEPDDTLPTETGFEVVS
jgi:hypothetical protein